MRLAIFLLLLIASSAYATNDQDLIAAGQRITLRPLNGHLPDITVKAWIDALKKPDSMPTWKVVHHTPELESVQAEVPLSDGGKYSLLMDVKSDWAGGPRLPRVLFSKIVRPDSTLWFDSIYETWSYFERQESLVPEADPMMERVRQAVLHAWQGYKQYAWGHDDLNPLSRTPRDWYGQSLLMTPIDAYDTLLLLGLVAEAHEAKRLIMQRSVFDMDASVQVFEVTIRLLGGLLAAYQMDGDPHWLMLATDLGM